MDFPSRVKSHFSAFSAIACASCSHTLMLAILFCLFVVTFEISELCSFILMSFAYSFSSPPPNNYNILFLMICNTGLGIWVLFLMGHLTLYLVQASLREISVFSFRFPTKMSLFTEYPLSTAACPCDDVKMFFNSCHRFVHSSWPL